MKKRTFRKLSKSALVLIYLVIVAGAVVRMTGSGMGCPDWPKCFGYYIPPTQERQLFFKPNHSYKKGMMILVDSQQFMVAKNDFKTGKIYQASNWDVYSVHDYAVYDPIHTWIEYVNRLIGALAGLPILILGISSFWFFKKNPKITLLSWLVIVSMGFQACLGKTVVDSNLAPFKITIHMVMALLIVALILYLIFSTKAYFKTQKYHSLFLVILSVGLVLTLIQIV
ncbi:MAG: COX15/CtaA family protein, partial [Bacteroidota bacterium]|nr:COX15/CtaA family protein [Bacteroidota bacterium]